MIFYKLLTLLKTLTVINSLHSIDFQPLTKKLQNDLKKNAKKSTSYKKNAYLCSVLINNDCFTDLKSKENEEISFDVRSCCSYLIRFLC